MCGIVGKIQRSGTPVSAGEIQRMMKALEHRGPDDSGMHLHGGVGLGHTRLSIIDLTVAGHQPMSSDDQTLWIVFNGEIYNYRELREVLRRRGYRFRSNSDTEVLIKLYEEFGVDCVQQLVGMFAFAIWDEREKRLFAARDRIGKKPFFYFHTTDTFIFASELQALLVDPRVPRIIDLAALDHYLTYQYIPSPRSIFPRVQKLPPASWLIYEQGRVTVKRYWNLVCSPTPSLSEEEIIDELRTRLRTAVRDRMISDVPLGAFLSGGIDSSIVVGLMSEASPSPVRTFSIGFGEADYTELHYARLVADHFGTKHTEFIVEPNAIDILPKLVWHLGEPFGDSSIIPTYYVSKLTRQHVTVALTGDGGDENFAGYPWYVIHAFAARYHRLPLAVRRAVVRTLGGFARRRRTTFYRHLWHFLLSSCGSLEDQYIASLSLFQVEQRGGLYTPEVAHSINTEDSSAYLRGWFAQTPRDLDPVAQALFVDTNTLLPEDFLVKTDRASMANSLELRSPFLDHRLMEFSARVPVRLKLHLFEKKYILKRAFRTFLPKEVLFRKRSPSQTRQPGRPTFESFVTDRILLRGKQGFALPIEHWFRGSLRQYVSDVLLDRKTLGRGIFRREPIERLIREHVETRVNHAHRLWALLILELWFRAVVDRTSKP